jgi:membrane associated rhomboid family serine protease
MVGVTAVISAAALASPALLQLLALIKLDVARGDLLTLEPWRLFTAALVHGGWLHLVFNLFAMDLGARLVQRLYGAQRLILWYLLGVIAASLTSAIWSPLTPSVGASGAVFGLFGAMVVVGKKIGADVRSIAAIIGINFFIGFAMGGVDWGAHLGGLIGGALAAQIVLAKR